MNKSLVSCRVYTRPDGCQRATDTARHGVHHHTSYAKACSEWKTESNRRDYRWGNVNGYGRAVDWCLFVLDYCLSTRCSCSWGGCAALNSVQTRWWRLTVDVGVVGDVHNPRFRHGGYDSLDCCQSQQRSDVEKHTLCGQSCYEEKDGR
jgi:hypothetical protein